MKLSTYSFRFFIGFLFLLIFGAAENASAQFFMNDVKRDSARSDRLTGGFIEKTTLAPGAGDLKITINVPSFQMTLWQGGKEVKTYPVGVGMKDYPIFIGSRAASAVIWNPEWTPPDADWVAASPNVKFGEIIPADDARNPLGKMKIPLGYNYLIHQAKGAGDLGSLVSHGCVRVMQSDIYDLAGKIVAALELPVTAAEIKSAEQTKKTLNLGLEPAIPVEITYDPIVVEAGKLHVYPDVYNYKRSTPEILRDELRANGVGDKYLTDATVTKMLAKASGKNQFVVSLQSIIDGKALTAGRIMPVVAPAAKPLPRSRRR